MGVAHQILVYDGLESVSEWHRVAPELPLIISPPDDAKTAKELTDFGSKNRIEVLDSSWEGYSSEIVAAAKNTGVKIWPDIQNQREDGSYFEKVIRLGFTGVQTDHPEELISWLKATHKR